MDEPNHIWVLDDEEVLCRLYNMAFSEVMGGGYELTCFTSLRSFLRAGSEPKNRKPDLIIADLTLGDGNFADVFTSASDFAATSGLKAPVIVVSGQTTLASIRLLLDAGAVDFITKPFPMDEIVAKVERQLRCGARKEKTLFTVDPWTMLVTGAKGAPISLTAKQFQLMTMFGASADYLLSRDEIISQLWNNVSVSRKTIDVHISILRQRLKPLGLSVQFVAPQHYRLY